MTRVVEIRTGARLHFGLFDTRSSSGRQGGIGMMVDRPGWRLRGTQSESDLINADAAITERVERFLNPLSPARTPSGGVRIDVLSSIPAHRGLGSGTQLARAIARLLQELTLLKSTADTPHGRGERSLVGTLGFAQGGFIIDPGTRPLLADPRPRCLPVPEPWRLIIIEPTLATTCSGEMESQAFERLPPIRDEIRARLAKLVENRIQPGIERQSFPDFAAGVGEFNRIVGEQFAPSQGGIYAHPIVRELADVLQGTEWPYLAQSSWGAAAVVLCENRDAAKRLETFLETNLNSSEIRLIHASPRNRAAEVMITSS